MSVLIYSGSSIYLSVVLEKLRVSDNKVLKCSDPVSICFRPETFWKCITGSSKLCLNYCFIFYVSDNKYWVVVLIKHYYSMKVRKVDWNFFFLNEPDIRDTCIP